jgi:hypothetical protein
VSPSVDCGGRDDREPQPSDGPDYHADHAAWKRRQAKPTLAEVIDWTVQAWQAIEAHGRAVVGRIKASEL